MSCAYATLTTNDAYVVGAMALAHSIRRRMSAAVPIICLVTDLVSESSREALELVFDRIHMVALLDSADERRLGLLGRPELGPTFTKIALWSLLDYEKIVYLDADMLVLQNVEDLLEREELSAAPDVGWPDCFNSGLMVLRPSETTHRALLEMAQTEGSFDGGDQGLLNNYFAGWSTGPASRRIPFTYNLVFTASYGYLPALERFKNQVKAVHFIGSPKPWQYHRQDNGKVISSGLSAYLGEYVGAWWQEYDQLVHSYPKLLELPLFSFSKTSRLTRQLFSPDFSALSLTAATTPPTTMGSQTTSNDFANYRIKWATDVEAFFQKNGEASLQKLRSLSTDTISQPPPALTATQPNSSIVNESSAGAKASAAAPNRPRYSFPDS